MSCKKAVCPFCGKNIYFTIKYSDYACEDANCIVSHGLKDFIEKLKLPLKILKENTMENCNHKHPNGISAVEYCSIYEMRSSDMYCTICGKNGTRKELEG